MTFVTACAWVFALLCAFTILFQVALALGAPWGELTLGGRHPGVLPGAWRCVPVFSALLLVAFMVIVLVRAGPPTAGLVPHALAPAALHAHLHTLAWVVVGYNALGCVVNTITPSRRERQLWVPVLLVMLVTSIVVARH